MRKTGFCFIYMFLMLHTVAWGQVRYATARLQSMAQQLPVDWSKLVYGENNGFTYSGHPLTIYVNEWNEVTHIGYRLFPADIRKSSPSPVYDFLERYFLELDLLKDIDKSMRLALDKVQLNAKTPEIIHTLDGSERLQVDMLSLKRYQVSWSKNNLNILTITFDMDYQLLSGCNSIEAEKKLIRELRRYCQQDLYEPIEDLPETNVTDNDFWQVDKGSYILDEIRHTLYYEKKEKKEWSLVCDISHPIWSTFNLMLSTNIEHHCNLDMVVDLYGYHQTKLIIPLKKWIAFCLEQGCKAYVGIKTHRNNTITGTVFMVNEKMGYNHMLTIELNKNIIAHRKGDIRSRLYAYIPLHNVSDDYFKFYTKIPDMDTLK